MPAAFERCRAGGGRIRTISGPNKQFNLSAGQYAHVCFDSRGAHRGHVKVKKDRELDSAAHKAKRR